MGDTWSKTKLEITGKMSENKSIITPDSEIVLS